MKGRRYNLILVISILCVCACTDQKTKSDSDAYHYKPDDQNLHDTIVHLDSVFFEAYNTCSVNFENYASFYADTIEFYHDKGGLTNTKAEILEATRKNICSKVRRELVKGSVEVYPIPNYGAVEMGLHRFYNNTEHQKTPSEPGKFIIIWRNQNNQWKITRVVSLH